MNNVLELTDINIKSKKIERISGRLASKVRLTPATVLSLRKNIDSEALNKAITIYNNTYSELRNAVVSAEVALAEQEARDSAISNPKAQKEEELRKNQIEEDNLVASITSVEVTKPRLNKYKLDVQNLNGKFGTLGKNFGVNVKSGYAPKALSIPVIFAKTYKTILKNSDLYKFASKLKNVDPTISKESGFASSVEKTKKVANWRSLFDGVETEQTPEIVVAMDGHDDQEEDEIDFVVENKGLTEEELSHRKMMGQLGDELQEVRRLKNTPNGIASPFSVGLDERENSLLNMLSSLSGVETIAKRKTTTTTKKVDNTEFQNLIEQIVGYKEPISEEEHRKKEESLQDYYSDPEVSEIIENLRHKDVLFSFNQPEAYEKVMAAERLDNEKRASESTAVDILDTDEETYDDTQNTILALDAIKQAEMIQEQEQEQEEILKSAEEQARMIQHEKEQQDIIIGAEEQARLLQRQNELDEIKAGAEEQAKMLKTLYDFMDKQEALEKEQERIKRELIEGAKEQAQEIQEENERIDLINGANEQAQQLHNYNEYIDLINAANSQAQEIQRKNEQADLINGAEEQAKLLNAIPNEIGNMEKLADQIVYQNTPEDGVFQGVEEQAKELQKRNEEIDLINGADEQAQFLQAGNEYIELIDSAHELARKINSGSQKNDSSNVTDEERKELINGAIEQARELQYKNEKAELVNGAEEQARELQYKNEKAELVNGAEEQARELQYKNEKAELVNGAEEQARELQYKNEKAELVNGAEEQAKEIIKASQLKISSIYDKLGVELIDGVDRYGNFVSPSRPIKLRNVQMNNMNSRLASRNSSTKTKKEVLSSLKSQLDSNDFDFLKYSDDKAVGLKVA